MNNFADFFDTRRPLLLALASEGEAGAVLKALASSASGERPGAPAHGNDVGAIEATKAPGDWNTLHFENFSLIQTGVGKANAAGAVTRELILGQNKERNYAGVLSLGIAGSLKPDVKIGDTVCATVVRFGDEGTPCVDDQDWTCLETSGWAQTRFECTQSDWMKYLLAHCDHEGTIATVSTISGTDQIAQDYLKRTDALAEGMEGAAIAQVCSRLNVPFGEFRIVSNRCGNRGFNKLDIPTSFRRMIETVRSWGFSTVTKIGV